MTLEKMERRGRDEISLLEEEMIQLSVKSSSIVHTRKPTLLCTTWTKKSYNLDSLRAQLRCIWKIKKKFEIQIVWQNLFMVMFEDKEDLKSILEGRQWFFRKHLIIFYRLLESMERRKVKLVMSPFWVKVSPCPPECDKKDLMHVVGILLVGYYILKSKGIFVELEFNLMQRSL